MPILGSSNSAANKDMKAKSWTNEDTIICLSKKHREKEKLLVTSNFCFSPQCFQQQSVVEVLKRVSMELWVNVSAKRYKPYKPAQSDQSDMGQNFLLGVN